MKNKVIFGAGAMGQRAYQEAKQLGIQINYFCDNNPSKWGKYLEQVPIISPCDLEKLPKDSVVIVANKFAHEEITKQVYEMGFHFIINKKDLKLWYKIPYLKTIGEFAKDESLASDTKPYLSILIKGKHVSKADILFCENSIRSSKIHISYEVMIWEEEVPVPNGEVIVILEGDSLVADYWLSHLLWQYEKYNKNCIVGSKSVEAKGSIIQAGYILWNDFSYEAYGYGEVFSEPEYEYVREVDLVSQNGMLFSKKYWDCYSNSCREFGTGFESTIDFCLIMKKKKIPLVFQPFSRVIEKKKDIITDNPVVVQDQRICKKWKMFVREYYHDPSHGYQLEVTNQKPCKFVMMLADEGIAEYDTNAGHRATYHYIRLFLSMGAQILYLVDNMFYSDKYTPLYQQMGICVTYGERWAGHCNTLLKEHLDEFQYAFLNRPHIAKKHISLLRENKKLVTAHFGHDLHYLRLHREFELTGNDLYRKEAQRMREIEYDLINQVDYTGYPSIVEVNLLRQKFPEANIEYFPLYCYEEYVKKKRNTKAEGILFVGGFNHRPNVDAAKLLVKEIMPLIRRKGIKDTVYLVGSNPPKELLDLQNDDIIVTGYVDDKMLKQFYEECRISVAPLQFGAGMKGKVLEAMYYGIPLVTTPIGAEGLIDIEKILKIGSGPEEIADHMIELYRNEKLIEEMSYNEYQYIIGHFGKEQMERVILNHIMSKTLAD